ncbi:hypothetical protein DL93DRAFT_2152373 [Clavulina sp. PMI_390]|nr:hypothetical protein DL93DRAFT_2152373 [Clavulina sp. PMI_390]
MNGHDDDTTPRDLVALFHCSFHVTKGNEVDWSLTSYPELTLDGVEYLTLPSGLHAIEEDVLYYTHNDHHGVCVFRRRETSEEGLRGARLGALCVLVAKSASPQPWLHLPALKRLSDTIDVSENSVPTSTFVQHFEDRRAAFPILETDALLQSSIFHRLSNPIEPISSFPEFLATLGPCTPTLLKAILCSRRIVIYTHPSTEMASRFATLATQICFSSLPSHSQQAFTESFSNVGLVGLFDIERLKAMSQNGQGWIACTTEKLFLEKPQLYDMVIDLTTPPAPASRPLLFQSYPTSPPSSSPATYRLRPIAPTFSDIYLWLQTIKTSHIFQQELSQNGSQHVITASWENFWVGLVWLWSVTRSFLFGRGGSIRLEGYEGSPGILSGPDGDDTAGDDNQPPHSPTSAVLLLDREPTGPNSRSDIQAMLTYTQEYLSRFSLQAETHLPVAATQDSQATDESAPVVALHPSDIALFSLNPFSSVDAEFTKSCITATARRRSQYSAEPSGAGGSGSGSAIPHIEVQRPVSELLSSLFGA